MSFCCWSYKTDKNLVGCNILWPLPRGQRGVSGDCRRFITSQKERSFKEKAMMCCCYEVTWLKLGSCTWRSTCCQDPPCAAVPARCPALQGSHCSRWSCRRRKRKAAHGPKCDQCVINYTFVCFLSSISHLCWCQCCSRLLVRQALGGPACPGPHWSRGEGLSAVLTGKSCEGVGSWGCNNCTSKVPLIRSELTTRCFLHVARLPYCFPFIAFECFFVALPKVGML